MMDQEAGSLALVDLAQGWPVQGYVVPSVFREGVVRLVYALEASGSLGRVLWGSVRIFADGSVLCALAPSSNSSSSVGST